eukprot:638363-Pleurochrysis_carterae.AAC.1
MNVIACTIDLNCLQPTKYDLVNVGKMHGIKLLKATVPPNNRRGGARPTIIMRLKVLKRYLKAWQAQIPRE